MNKLNLLLITGALLGTSAFGGAIAVSHAQSPTIVLAQEIEGEVEEETESETTNQELLDKIKELEETIKNQSEQIWNKELVSGLTIGGAIIFAMELLLVILRSGFNKKKDGQFNDKLALLEDKYTDLVDKYNKAKENTDKFLQTACDEMNSIKNQCVELVKEINTVLPQLKQYGQFDQKLVTVINILDTISFTPENVKNGVCEKVKQLIDEVK